MIKGRTCAAVVCVAFVLGVVSSETVGLVRDKPAVASSPEENQAALNKYRAGCGLPPLEYSAQLYKEALATANENARAGRLQHAPIRWGGEIIAYNYDGGFREALQQWRASRVGHREQLESRSFRRCGCACVWFQGRFYSCVRFD